MVKVRRSQAAPGIESLELAVMVSQIPRGVVVVVANRRSYCRNESLSERGWKRLDILNYDSDPAGKSGQLRGVQLDQTEKY